MVDPKVLLRLRSSGDSLCHCCILRRSNIILQSGAPALIRFYLSTALPVDEFQ